MQLNSSRALLIVCDLDNTLYDWVSYFVPAFYSMVDEAARILNCPHERLLDELREVHQRHHDSEHPFALMETKTVIALVSRADQREAHKLLDPAFHAFNSIRKRNLQLFPGVKETLAGLLLDGNKLVAHTESKYFSAVGRLKKLDVYDSFGHIYCRERSAPSLVPSHVADTVRAIELDGRVTELSHHQRKPDVDVLLEICHREGFAPKDTIYIGDSLSRDILMAKRANVFAVWAKYGVSTDSEQYRKLVRVTHWTEHEVEAERQLKHEALQIDPDFICHSSFAELSRAIDVVRASRQW